MTEPLGAWTTELCAALGLDPGALAGDDVRTAVLDLARDAAHGVARPAAPLTTFLVGYAAGRRGGGAETVVSLAGEAAARARSRVAGNEDGGGGDDEDGGQVSRSSPA